MRPLLRHTVAEKPFPPPRVLQFGGGNFIRAYFNWMLDAMNEQTGFNGSAILVKPTPGGDYEALKAQEGLFHVCLRGIVDGKPKDDFQLVRSIGQVIQPYRDYARFQDTARIRELKVVVSNTTEAGISYRPEDKLSDSPARSFPGKLCQWLYHRYRSLEGNPESGCYVLPLELVEDNGETLKKIVLKHAGQWGLEEGFVYWLNRYNTFCNTLVDRIVPGYPSTEADAIRKQLGYDDQCLVLAEPYFLLAIEHYGDLPEVFPARKAGLNVHFTNDLSAFRTLKVRILNGAHTAMVPVGLLAGLSTVGSVMRDAQVSAFLEAMLREEVVPTMDADRQKAMAYVDDTLDRFRNPYVQHQLADIALNSVAKVASRYLPTIIEHFRQFGRLPDRLCLALAAMIRFYRGKWHGETLPIRDTEQAVQHFREAWGASTMEACVRKSLEIWPVIPKDMVQPLRHKLTVLLEQLEEKDIRALLN